MKVEVINTRYDYEMTKRVNEFLDSIKDKYDLVDIKYTTATTGSSAWNCVMIVYKEKGELNE